MPGSGYGSPEFRRWQQRPHWAYYASKYGDSVAAGGIKAYQASKYAAFAHSGYKLGKKLINSFSQNEKTNKRERSESMAPVTPRRGRSRTPANRQRSASAYPTPGGRRRSMSDVVMRSRSRTVAPIRKAKKASKYRNMSAASSSSAGIVSAPKGLRSTPDTFQKSGVYFTREQGSTISGSALLKYQSILLMHANYGKDQLINDISLALAKAVASRALGITVQNVNTDIMVGGSGRNVLIEMSYKISPTGGLLFHTFTISPIQSVQGFATAFATWWKGLSGTYAHLTFCDMLVYRQSVATTPLVGNEYIGKYNLKRCSVLLYSKSSLKMQNRTVNSSGNDEADDVDNVPLYGKVYQGPGNYFLVNDNYYNPLITFQSNYLVDGYDKTSDLCEPPPLGQMQRCRTIGKAHLDPGQIKTSVLTDTRKLNINQLNSIIGKSEATSNTLPLGKQRSFIYEKMIQAVATTDITAIKMAYEVDLKTGAIFNLVKETPTTQIVTLSPE